MHAVAEENSLDINNNMKKKNADDNCTSTYTIVRIYILKLSPPDSD